MNFENEDSNDFMDKFEKYKAMREKEQGLYEVEELKDNNSFSLSELKTIIFLLSNIKNITNSQKEDVKSFVKKATNIIKLKSNIDI